MERDAILRGVQRILESKPEIVFAYVFGSAADSECFRDVDIAIYVEERKLAVAEEIYDLRLGVELENAVKARVDLILINNAPDHLIHQISKGKLIVNRDDDFRTDFLCASWKRYFDIQPKRLQAYFDMLS
jgi:predicted nucleotidyltransferase